MEDKKTKELRKGEETGREREGGAQGI